MFILSLRGRFGILISLRLHGLIGVMILVLFGSNTVGVQVAAILFFLIGSVLVLRYMNENEDRLVFKVWKPDNGHIHQTQRLRKQLLTSKAHRL
tara:strand:- start:205 stop:486 length:282 start_codon:yes stop_codon:yes gene_type:complete